MHYLETILVAVSPNPASPFETKFLVQEKDGKYHLPVEAVDYEETCSDAVRLLFEKCFGYSLSYIQHKQGILYDHIGRRGFWQGTERWIAVPYGCLMPHEAGREAPKAGKWITFPEVSAAEFYGDHKEILTETARLLYV